MTAIESDHPRSIKPTTTGNGGRSKNSKIWVGNIRAIGLIAEREGRVGMRSGEVAPEDEARRGDPSLHT